METTNTVYHTKITTTTTKTPILRNSFPQIEKPDNNFQFGNDRRHNAKSARNYQATPSQHPNRFCKGNKCESRQIRPPTPLIYSNQRECKQILSTSPRNYCKPRGRTTIPSNLTYCVHKQSSEISDMPCNQSAFNGILQNSIGNNSMGLIVSDNYRKRRNISSTSTRIIPKTKRHCITPISVVDDLLNEWDEVEYKTLMDFFREYQTRRGRVYKN